MILIAVDAQGCHAFSIEISENRYHRPKYMEALYNSIEMVFKKLKHNKKYPITITEVDDDKTSSKKQKGKTQPLERGKKLSGGSVGRSKSKRIVLERSEGSLQTYKATDRSWDKSV